jgi:5-methyltetrahydropteroyltriglutamate--homocysteine methyltransferase
LLEYDDIRSGSFEPLKDVSDSKFVVLGLVSTKTSTIESPAELRQRISEASRYFPLERLGVSPQCGFASSVLGNQISAEDQRQKLEVVVRTAQSIWG